MPPLQIKQLQNQDSLSVAAPAPQPTLTVAKPVPQPTLTVQPVSQPTLNSTVQIAHPPPLQMGDQTFMQSGGIAGAQDTTQGQLVSPADKFASDIANLTNQHIVQPISGLAQQVAHGPLGTFLGVSLAKLEHNSLQAQQIEEEGKQQLKQQYTPIKTKNGYSYTPALINAALGAEGGGPEDISKTPADKFNDNVNDLTTNNASPKGQSSAPKTPADQFQQAAQDLSQQKAQSESSTPSIAPVSNVEEVLGHPLERSGQLKLPLNMNEGAFSPEDIKNLEQQISQPKSPSLDELVNGPTETNPYVYGTDALGNPETNINEAAYKSPGIDLSPFEGMDKMSPEERVINVAKRGGTYDQAVKTYMNAAPFKEEVAREDVTNILRNAGIMPSGGFRGEFNPEESALGISPLPIDKEADVPHQATKEGSAIKITSLQNRAEHLGAAGREFVQRATNVRVERRLYEAELTKRLEPFFNLDKDRQAEAFDVKEGKATTNDPEVQAAVDALNDTMPRARQDAVAAGVNGGYRENYMPHIYPKGFFNRPKNFNEAVDYLLKTGQADSKEIAVKMMNQYKDGEYMGSKQFGNLELSRELDLPGYIKDESAVRQYIQGVARRTAQAHQFGPKNEIIANLIQRAQENGDDGRALAEVAARYLNPVKGGGDALDKVLTGYRKGLNVLQLQKAAISHLPQGFANVGSEVGFARYFNAVRNRVFSPEAKQYLDEAGFNVEKYEKPSGVGRVTALLLRQVRQFHREVAGVAGRDYAEALASKGDEASLRQWGVTGDIARDADGRIQLSDAQRVQVSHNLADRTIFTDDPLQSPAFVQNKMGKFIGQYRTAYTFKQAGYINNLFKQAAQGNIAPVLRYLGVAVPVSGALVTIGKNLFKNPTANPLPTNGKELKKFIADSLPNSGVLSIGGGLADSAYNAARFNYNNDYRWQNAASAVAPGAGFLVQAGQNIDNALRGNPKSLEKQALSMVPGGGAISSRVFPTKIVSPQQQQFLDAYQKGLANLNKQLNPPFSKSANPNAVKQYAGMRADVQAYLTKNHTPDGKTILLNQFQQAESYGKLASDPQALKLVQQFEKSLPNHNPMWDLNTNALQIYLSYKSMIPGDPNQAVLEQVYPWLKDQFQKEAQWGKSLQGMPNTVEGDGYVPYPNISPQQQDMLNQVEALSAVPNRTPDQETQLQNLESNPDLQAAFALLNKYTNDRRALWPGVQPIPYPSQNLSPDQEAMLQYEGSLSKGQKAAFIRANQDAWNSLEQILAENTLYNVERYGGIVQQGGTEPNLLKDIYNLGKYDIAQGVNAQGQKTYVLNPSLAYGGGSQGGFSFGGSGNSSSGGSSKKSKSGFRVSSSRTKKLPRPPFAKKIKAKKLYLKKAPRSHNKVKLAKPQKGLNLTPVRGLQPTQVIRPTQVLKIKA